MLKWIFIVFIVGIILSAFVGRRLEQTNGISPKSAPAVLEQKAAAPAKEVAEPSAFSDEASTVSEPVKKLSVPQERLRNRVAPVREAPIKGDILPI